VVKKFVSSFGLDLVELFRNSPIVSCGDARVFCYAALASSTFCLETQPSGAGSEAKMSFNVDTAFAWKFILSGEVSPGSTLCEKEVQRVRK
jgi:hypothetical protein